MQPHVESRGSGVHTTSPTVLDAIRSRRSVRAFKPEHVSAPLIRVLLEAAVHAPTAMHLEPWSFVVVENHATLKMISDAAKTMWAARAHADLHTAAMLPRASHFAEQLASPDFNLFYDASTLVVICARGGNEFAAADCWLAAENLMLAACSLGLGTCVIGSAVAALNTPEVKIELNIPFDVLAVAPIIVGQPRGPLPASTRHEPQIISWKK